MSIRRHGAILTCVITATLVVPDVPAQVSTADGDPFSFFRPVVHLSPAERGRIDRGEVIVRSLPGEGGEVALLAVSRLDAAPDALIAWTRAIEALKRGPFVSAIRRFSDPPAIADLDELLLENDDLEAIRRCRSGDCGLKLTDHEIQRLRVAVAQAGPEWKGAVQGEFRRLVLQRVARYLSGGLAGLSPHVDRATPMHPREVFETILEHSAFLDRRPDLVRELRGPPGIGPQAAESFLYWSKEYYGRGKPVVAVTHVHIVRSEDPRAPRVMVLGQEVFATHYRDGSLGTTAVLAGGDGFNYLVYLNRSRLDVLGGLFGGVKRIIVERRLAGEVAPLIAAVRRRLESPGPEPGGSARPVP